MTTNETSFFRDGTPFEIMKTHVLPQFQASRASSRRLRIWSAGCATGEEPYTLALLIRERAPELAGWDVQIIATDVNRAALAIAQEKAPDTPFIFVTGSLGEEMAINALKTGATDFVLKHRLATLPPAVHRALHLLACTRSAFGPHPPGDGQALQPQPTPWIRGIRSANEPQGGNAGP